MEDDLGDLRVPDILNAGRGWRSRARRLLGRREKSKYHAIWISVARHGVCPPLCEHVPTDGKVHRLVWSNAGTPDMEVYVDGERVR